MHETAEIRLSGAGGQGLILAAGILSNALIAEGRSVAQSQSYEPTSRGGLSRSDLVISDGEADFPLATALDYVVILDQVAVETSRGMIKQNAIVITDAKTVTDPPKGDFHLIELPISETAIRLGSRRIANIISLGALTAMGDLCDRETIGEALKKRSPGAFLALNEKAFESGWEMAQQSPPAV